LFSVIVPTHNRPHLLAEAVASVLSQTIGDLEVLVVNDGDDEVAVTHERRLRVVERDQTGGVAAARNAGLNVATGRYVTFLDDDDVFLPRRLEIALEGLESAPVARCLECPMGSDVSASSRPRSRSTTGWVHDTILDGIDAVAKTVALERQLAPRFNEEYLACEDVEWWIRLSSLAPVTTVHEVGYLTRPNPAPVGLNGAQARLMFNKRLLDDYPEYFRTHPRARAFRHKRIGLRELDFGDRGAARRSFRRSLRASPSARTAWHYLRTWSPRRRSAAS
jgi:glycosyltransferase involved in cell wall biosynthesis